jgi:Helix-turn-helix domain
MTRLASSRTPKRRLSDPAAVEAMKKLRETFDLITIQQLAQRWGVCVRTIRRMHAQGDAPPRQKHGRQKKYSLREVEGWEHDKRSKGEHVPEVVAEVKIELAPTFQELLNLSKDDIGRCS